MVSNCQIQLIYILLLLYLGIIDIAYFAKKLSQSTTDCFYFIIVYFLIQEAFHVIKQVFETLCVMITGFIDGMIEAEI